MKDKGNIKVYFSDVVETMITYIIMMSIILGLSFLFNFLIIACIINFGIILFFFVYYKKELLFFLNVKSELKNDENIKEVNVVFDKIETDLKYGKPKRREFFKRYTTPRFQFYHEGKLYRIGMRLNGNIYSDVRGKEFKIYYLENSRVIIKIIAIFKIDNSLKDDYKINFGNIFFE